MITIEDTTARTVARFAANFDHHDPEFDPDLAILVHRAIREHTPVTWSRAHGGMWILSRYRDVLAALKDHTTFVSGQGVFFPRPPGAPRFAPLEYDPPEQTAFRLLMKPPFKLGQAHRLEPRIAELIAGLAGPLARRGEADLIAELALPLPLAVVALAVGFTPRAQARIRELTANTWKRMPTDRSADGFWAPFAALFREELTRAREEPGEDYLSTLVRATIDGRPVTEDELYVMLVAFAIAGHETAMNTLAHLLSHLADHPEHQDLLRERPSLMPDAIEETLRLWTPVDHGTRVTSREVEVAGTRIPRGSRVLLLAGAANRDPEQFPDPDEFRLDRGPIRHLTFGQGAHFCIGAHVARIEFLAVLRELARHPNYIRTGPSRRYYENGRHICVDTLPVRFAGAALPGRAAGLVAGPSVPF